MPVAGTVTQHDRETSLDLVIGSLETAWVPMIAESEEFYSYIPFPPGRFITGLTDIATMRSLGGTVNGTNGRFLDVGCGIGTKLLLARFLGWSDVTGIELRPAYAEVAKRLCPEVGVEMADAFEWDRYGEFDVIFMYRPCVPEDLERRLEERVLSMMKPGSFAFFGQPVTRGPEIRGV